MERKYMATVDFISLHDLKKFIGIIKEAGGNVSISDREKPNYNSMLDNPIAISNIESDTIFNSDIQIYASSPIDLERAKNEFNLEFGEIGEKTPAYELLESISNFKGYVTSAK